ncbi:class I SAM-dependent methyltransferase [Acinetobacter faecalis]|uniref:class I SAM-dependent methyltransferase n=1 Tax=Acinetobacter faecalis TaxID=2665161 RepID=UPI002A91687B|nr:methyltransferase domain-containing protein [Acinetobacter faecalis]MDY6483543.1 methyltransferase domain-containing protein [Acinetobacter faecalis]MDY6523993.1 methyltransferase domain-containing protein [Acinetobacter faecalis]
MNKQDGYILDTTYPVYFYKEMQPIWLKTIFDVMGLKTVELDKSFSYLELGCAKGINLIIAAIYYPQAQFTGVDFNPEHIKFAQYIAQKLELTNIEFIESNFEDFRKTNTDKFDFIVNHGTFSWISFEQQQNILEIASKFLTDLGIFYLHYMCYPGSTDLQPIQKLLNLVDQNSGLHSLDSIQRGQHLFMSLLKSGAYVDHPRMKQILKTFEQPDEYLAHEFLTDHWQPFYSVDLHKRVFNVAHTAFIGSANLCDNIESVSIPTKLQSIVEETQDPALKEYLKDIARNAKQRCDIFQKLPSKLIVDQHLQTLANLKFTCVKKYNKKQNIVFKTSIGDIQAPQEIVQEVLNHIEQLDMSFAELCKLEPFQNNLYFLIETLFLLMNADYIYPIVNESTKVDGVKVTVFNQIMQDFNLKISLKNNGVVTTCST